MAVEVAAPTLVPLVTFTCKIDHDQIESARGVRFHFGGYRTAVSTGTFSFHAVGSGTGEQTSK